MSRKRVAFLYLASVAIILQSFMLIFASQKAEAVVATVPSMFSSMTTGATHTCGINSGKLYCWGQNHVGQLGIDTLVDSKVPIPVDTTGLLAGKIISHVAAGGYNTCAVAEEKAYCWGVNDGSGELGNGVFGASERVPVAVDTSGVLAGKTITDISAGGAHSCAIASGSVYCWGYGNEGAIGNNSTQDSLVPVAVDVASGLTGKTITNLSSGENFTCVLASGKPYCWGYNNEGELGNNSTDNSLVPVAVDTSGVLEGKIITDLDSGGSHACILASGKPYCWGDGYFGQLGNNSTDNSLVPVAVDTSGVLEGKMVTSFSAGGVHTCSMADGGVYCWGWNADGELGDSSTTDSLTPVAVKTRGVLDGNTLTNLANGSEHTCGLASTQVYCWGANYAGQLGDGSTDNSSVPVAVDTSGVLNGKTVTRVAAGGTNTCVLAGGQVYCWGANYAGQLGDGSTDNSSVPVAVDTSGVLNGKAILDISIGDGHACVLAGGAVYCWGYGQQGQLGDGSTDNSLVPVAVDTSGVLQNKTVTKVLASQSFSCAIADGAAYCWGYNLGGQLGDGSTDNSSVPVAVDTSGVLNEKTVTNISSTYEHTCTIADGAAYCWGANYVGQLGDGSTDNSLVPVAVDTSGVLAGKAVTDIGSGAFHNCVIADSDVYCWGDSSFGQLGNNATEDGVFPPVAVDTSGVLAGKSVTDISVSTTHTCALADGQAYCWGNNDGGQLGNATTLSSSVPSAIYTGIISSYFVAPTITISGNPLTDGAILPTMPAFSGVAEPGYTITVTVHSDPVSCSDAVDGGGAWSCTIPTDLPAGAHTVVVTATDQFGGIYTLGPTGVFVAASQDSGGNTGGNSSSTSGTPPSQSSSQSNKNVVAEGNDTEGVSVEEKNTSTDDKVALNDTQTDDNDRSHDKKLATAGEEQNWLHLAGIATGIIVLLGAVVFGMRRLVNGA